MKLQLIDSDALWKAFHDEEGDSWDEQHEIDCYSFSQCENIINDAPVIEAIPIEWLLKKYSWLTMMGEIIKDWEKENANTN